MPALQALHMDADNNIWLATKNKGLYRLDSTRDVFEFFSHNDALTDRTAAIGSIKGDKRNNLLVSDGAGIHIFNSISKKLQHFEHQPGFPGPSQKQASYIFEDKDWNTWVGYAPSGIDVVNRQGLHVKNFLYTPLEEGLKKKLGEVLALKKEGNGRLLLGTRSGLYIFDQSTARIEPFSFTDIGFGSGQDFAVSAVLKDRFGNLWVAIEGQGLLRISAGENQDFRRYFHDPEHEGSAVIHDLLQDREGNIWAASEMGVSRFDSLTNSFKQIFPSPELADADIEWRVKSIFEDSLIETA